MRAERGLPMQMLALALAFVTGAVAADVTAAEPAVAAQDAPPLAAATPAAPKPLPDVELLEFQFQGTAAAVELIDTIRRATLRSQTVHVDRAA